DLVSAHGHDVGMSALVRLLVGIHRDELDLQGFRDHAIDGVASAATAANDLDSRSTFVQLAFFHIDQVVLLRMCSGHGELKLVFCVLSRKNLAATSLFFDTCCRMWPAAACCCNPRVLEPPTSPTRPRRRTTVREPCRRARSDRAVDRAAPMC